MRIRLRPAKTRKIEIRVEEQTYKAIESQIKAGEARDISSYVRKALELKLRKNNHQTTTNISKLLTDELEQEMENFLNSSLAAKLGIENKHQLISQAVRSFLHTYRPFLHRTDSTRIFLRLNDTIYVTICTTRPGLAYHWRQLLKFIHENGIAIKVKLYLSRDSEHLIEAYLAALTVNATFIIGKFTETTTAKMELEDTLTLINELGIPLEIITATDQSYKGTQHLLEEAQQKEQQLEAYTLKEIETTLISKRQNITN